MSAKNLFASRTVWFALFQIAAGLVAIVAPGAAEPALAVLAPEAMAMMPPDVQGVVLESLLRAVGLGMVVKGGLDIWLRIKTDQPVKIGKPPSPPMPVVLLLILPLALSGCEFFRSLNTEENRRVGVEAAKSVISTLKEDGSWGLDDTEFTLALTACQVLAAYLPQIEDEEAQRAELIALGQDVCEVVGVALAKAPESAPEPPVAPEGA